MLKCRECGRIYPVAEGFCPMDGTPLADVACDEPAADGEARLGDVLDRRYRIDELIGEGGMAHVYRVTHTMIGKSLAAKVIRHELRNDDEVIRRFLREAQIVSSIKHPNVVDISDYGATDEGGAFCVMELLRGRTLAAAIDEDGAFAPEEALGIALQICQGLHHSHETGVVHRDLKPQNIFVCDPKNGRDAVVKLIDFGVARAGNRITVVGAVLGTPEYMSPEQVRGDLVDAGADLYALGIILFELLTAAVPYQSDDVALTMQSHLHAPTPKMTQVDPQLAGLAQTQALIERLMAKDRRDRPDTAAEAAVLLQQAMAADLGTETSERVMRSTLNVASGDISKTPSLQVAPVKPWADRQMQWNPEFHSAEQAAPPTVPLDLESTDTDAAPAPTRGRSLPWIIAATAMVAAGATVAGYAAVGGFERAPAVAAPGAPKVEIVSVPVPPPAEESYAEPSTAGVKSASDEQTAPPGASVASKANAPAGTDPVESAGADEPGSQHESEDRAAQQKARAPRRERTSAEPVRNRKKPTSPKPRTVPEPTRPQTSPTSPPTPAAADSEPEASPEPKPPTPADGDLRNPFG